MHKTTCSWATIISLIRAIDRMLCNWDGDILTCRPELVKRIDVQEIMTRNWWFKFFAMIGAIDRWLCSWRPWLTLRAEPLLIQQPPLSIFHLSSTYTKHSCFYGRDIWIFSSVRSSNSHPDLLVIHHPSTPLFQIPPVHDTGLSLSESLQL